MSFKPVSPNNSNGEIFPFSENGTVFDGTLVRIRRDVKTRTGNANVADFTGWEDHKDYAIFLTAGLIRTITEDLIGDRLRITFLGTEYNPETKRNFKKFSVDVWENDDDADEIPF